MLLFTRNYRGATIRRLLARAVDVRLNEPGKIGWPRIISRAVRVPLILIDRRVLDPGGWEGLILISGFTGGEG